MRKERERENERVKRKGIERDREKKYVLVGCRRSTNIEGTFPPRAILDKLY